MRRIKMLTMYHQCSTLERMLGVCETFGRLEGWTGLLNMLMVRKMPEM